MSGRYSVFLFFFPVTAAFILAYLLLPGVLLTSMGEISGSEKNLTRYANELREFAKGDVCSVKDLPPPAILPEGQADEQARLFRPTPVDPDVTPVPPEATPKRAGRSGGANGENTGDENSDVPTDEETVSLSQLMGSGVVLILAASEDGSGGSGSGFVVDDHHVVTNHHVVKDASKLFAINGASNRLIELSVVDVVADSGLGRGDLALLRSEEPLDLAAFTMVPFPNVMDSVFAAGYPGLVLNTDENFKRLIRGEAATAPSIVITNGRISAIQNRNEPVPLLVHSAEISQGNSGGPLVDECGRVVGINTFLIRDGDNHGGRAVYYAQPIARMLDAFSDSGVEFRVLEGVCGSVTARQVQVDSAPDAQADGE